jgi:hypothetical protein
MTTNKKHNWDKSGERCLNCGDKDWMASAECNGRMTTNKDIEEAVEVCEMVEEIGMPDDTIIPIWPTDTEMCLTHPLRVRHVKALKKSVKRLAEVEAENERLREALSILHTHLKDDYREETPPDLGNINYYIGVIDKALTQHVDKT